MPLSDCFCVSVNPSVYLSQCQSLSVILCHLVSISIFHAICFSHSVSVSLSHSVYLQHVSVSLFLSLCPCQFVPSALSLSVCPKCPLPSPPRLSPSSDFYCLDCYCYCYCYAWITMACSPYSLCFPRKEIAIWLQRISAITEKDGRSPDFR